MSKVDAVVLAGAPAGDLAPRGGRGSCRADGSPGGSPSHGNIGSPGGSPSHGNIGSPGGSPSHGKISRAMIPIAGKTMLAWVVDALRGASSIGRIAAVGNVPGDGVDLVIEPGGNLVENIRRGIEALKPEGFLLIVSSDVPLLTPDAVDDFVERAGKLDVEMAYPVIPRAHCEARYPGIKRTYLKTGDGVFTGGNIMLVQPDFISRNWETISGAYAARKQVFKLARMIGIGVLLRVIAARVFPDVLRLSTIERAASKMLGARVAAVVSAYPEIGEDVDKPSDLAAVERFLSSNGHSQQHS